MNSDTSAENRTGNNDNSSEETPRHSGSRDGGDRPARGGDRQFSDRRGGDNRNEERGGAMEVVVSHNIEKAMKILKRKLIKEGLFKELKARRYFEKPSEKKKRKEKESRKKVRKDEARLRKGPGLM